MSPFHQTLRLAVAVACLGITTVLAQAQMSSAPEPKDPELNSAKRETKIERKQPGFFHRPSKATPAEQLAFAADLKAHGKLRRATREYLALVHTWHGEPEAPTAQMAAATILMERCNYMSAFEEFQYLFVFFAGRFRYEEVVEAQFKIANSVLEERHMAVLGLNGFTDPQTALPLFKQIAINAPFWTHAAEVQYRIGRILEDTGEDLDATDAYALVGQRYPASPFAGDAAFRRTLCLRRIFQSCPRDETQCRAALSAIAAFLRDYPKHSGAAEAEQYRDELSETLASMYYDRAVFYDRIAQKPKSAIIAYRDFLQKFPLSTKAPTVTERIGELAALAEKTLEKKPQ
jgi:hypothetical protein